MVRAAVCSETTCSFTPSRSVAEWLRRRDTLSRRGSLLAPCENSRACAASRAPGLPSAPIGAKALVTSARRPALVALRLTPPLRLRSPGTLEGEVAEEGELPVSGLSRGRARMAVLPLDAFDVVSCNIALSTPLPGAAPMPSVLCSRRLGKEGLRGLEGLKA